jgi:hypothetical protein
MSDRKLLMEFARWRHGSEVDWQIDVEVIDAFLAARQPPGYDPNFGDERECACGHPYRRHFDTYENMSPASCKYCGCEAWHEPSARQPPGEPYPPRSEPIGPPSVAACAGCLNRATYCHACYHAPALDQWLATRQPPGEPCAACREAGYGHTPCGTCQWANDHPIRCAECGGTSEEQKGDCGGVLHDEPPPAPQRFWVVEKTVTGEHWRAYKTNARGEIVLGFESLWDTRAEAEADGRASGLPEWKP